MLEDALKRILIVEDDRVQNKNLKTLIEAMDRGILVYSAHNYHEAMAIAVSEHIDLFFFDIDLEDSINGYELAKKIREIEKYALSWMVFLTVNKKYELMSYKRVHCYEFVVKPYKKDQIEGLVKRLLFNFERTLGQKEKPFIVVESNHIHIKIYVDEIFFLEARGRGAEIVTVRGTVKTQYMPLKKLESLLAPFEQFIKAHRSYIVNVCYIREITRVTSRQSTITFINNEKTAFLSHKNRQVVDDAMNKLERKKKEEMDGDYTE